MQTRGNKAKRSKKSILADTKNLLYILYPAVQKTPKIERMEGAPMEMKRACYDLIRHYTTAKECPEVRLANIQQMFGAIGTLLASFELCVKYGLFTDKERLQIAMQIELIKEGAKKWRNATRSPKSQDQWTVGGEEPEEAAGSYD